MEVCFGLIFPFLSCGSDGVDDEDDGDEDDGDEDDENEDDNEQE